MTVQPVPDGYPQVVPSLLVDDVDGPLEYARPSSANAT